MRRISDRDPAISAEAEALARLTATRPDLLLTDQVDMLGDDPATWDHACTGAAWNDWRRAPMSAPTPVGDGPLLASTPMSVPAAPASDAVRQSDGALVLGDHRYRLERSLDLISVTCVLTDGTFAWRQRWRPASFLSAPSQSMELRDGMLLVLEGGMRLSVFDQTTGIPRGTFIVEDLGSGTAHVLADGLAIIGPLGVDNLLTLVDGRSSGHTLALTSQARWALPLGAQVLVCGHDGTARLYPGGRTVDLPDALTHAHSAPQATANGLHSGTTLWPWAR
jgi:hypothetical protein